MAAPKAESTERLASSRDRAAVNESEEEEAEEEDEEAEAEAAAASSA
jgi:hypothetical protein